MVLGLAALVGAAKACLRRRQIAHSTDDDERAGEMRNDQRWWAMENGDILQVLIDFLQ
jgi:hypothetical protein